ncbi:MAG TPA: CGNR zinc finger domain-containing protein [Vineibacter sp.]|nr:CGNR zinc finger domain-containing protein [Vineibacter sp.]
MRRKSDPFEWSGGHPALDLVNTLDERPFVQPIENLATYRDLVGFAELAGLIKPALAASLRTRIGPGSARIADRARRLREHLHGVLSAVHRKRTMPRRDLAAIASAVRVAHAARVLVASSSGGLASHRWARPTAAEIPLHACALAIEGLLTDVDRRRLRKCGASDCDVYFVDTSKGHRRQWCSMKNCGNREKQRRWRSSSG